MAARSMLRCGAEHRSIRAVGSEVTAASPAPAFLSLSQITYLKSILKECTSILEDYEDEILAVLIRHYKCVSAPTINTARPPPPPPASLQRLLEASLGYWPL